MPLYLKLYTVPHLKALTMVVKTYPMGKGMVAPFYSNKTLTHLKSKYLPNLHYLESYRSNIFHLSVSKFFVDIRYLHVHMLDQQCLVVHIYQGFEKLTNIGYPPV